MSHTCEVHLAQIVNEVACHSPTGEVNVQRVAVLGEREVASSDLIAYAREKAPQCDGSTVYTNAAKEKAIGRCVAEITYRVMYANEPGPTPQADVWVGVDGTDSKNAPPRPQTTSEVTAGKDDVGELDPASI